MKTEILSERSSDEDVLDDEQILLKTIFDNKNSVQVFEYLPDLRRFSYRNLNQLKSNIYIRSLTLYLNEFPDIFTFIQHTPNLIYLNIQAQLTHGTWKENLWKNNNNIKLEEFYLKFIQNYYRSQISFLRTDFDPVFHAIQSFSSSLITLSLDFSDIYLRNPTSILTNGIELENQLLKPLKKLQNFYFFVRLYGRKEVEQILSTFERFPWCIGVHQNGYLYSLPFPYHKLILCSKGTKNWKLFSNSVLKNSFPAKQRVEFVASHGRRLRRKM
jgi:hypothetical protein